MQCDCLTTVGAKLKEQGFRLSDKFQMFKISEDMNLRLVLGFPLERLDDKRLKRSDPKTLEMTFCPFCGKQMEPETPVAT